MEWSDIEYWVEVPLYSRSCLMRGIRKVKSLYFGHDLKEAKFFAKKYCGVVKLYKTQSVLTITTKYDFRKKEN